MPFSNYYVASNLTDLGNNMTRDVMSQRENERMMQAALMHALAQRQQQEQAQQQFQQELAFRNQQAQQQSAYQNLLLGLKEKELNNQMTGFTPRDVADQQYRYAALENSLNIAKENANHLDRQAAAAQITQQGLNQRDAAAAIEAWDYEAAAARAKAAEYNARLKSIKDAAAEFAKTRGAEWFTSQSTADKEAADKIKQGYAELMAALANDKRPGTISPDPSGEKFVEVLRPRPAQFQPQIPQGGLPQFMGNDYAPSRRGAPVGGPQANINDVPIKVQTSDGQVWNTTSSKFTAIRLRDPGAKIVSAATPNGPPPQQQVPTNTPQSNGLLGALYNNATGYYGNLRDQLLVPPMQKAYEGYQNYVVNPYEQLINFLNEPQSP